MGGGTDLDGGAAPSWGMVPRAVHDPYFTNDPIFRSCALKRASTPILGFADILVFVSGKMLPSNVGCDY